MPEAELGFIRAFEKNLVDGRWLWMTDRTGAMAGCFAFCNTGNL
jgi:hypothetical protein